MSPLGNFSTAEERKRICGEGAFERQLGHKGGVSWWDEHPYKKRRERTIPPHPNPLHSLNHMKTPWEEASWQPGRGPTSGTESKAIRLRGLLSLQLWGLHFSCLSHPVCGILLWQLNLLNTPGIIMKKGWGRHIWEIFRMHIGQKNYMSDCILQIWKELCYFYNTVSSLFYFIL